MTYLGHSPRGMHGYLDSLKEKIRSFDREKVEQELYGIFGLIRQEPYVRQMLQDGKMVYEVSELLGFENSTYFSRVFKRYTDVSPDTYRKQM